MNIRPSILIGALVILVVSVALIVWRLKQPGKTAPGAPVPVENMATTSGRPVEKAAAATFRNNNGWQMPESPAAEGDAPIVFYGKLEDQSDNPVAEAEITGTTIYHLGGSERTARFSTTSDANGFFTLDAGTGASLEVMPHKPGYALAATNNGGYYSLLRPEAQRQHPDPNRPVVIKMWKLQGAEPLAAIDQRYQFYYATNSPLYFDFINGEMVPSGGDLKLTINRPAGYLSPDAPQDWSVEIEGVDGGLMEVTPGQWQTTYWAPVDGYQPKIELLMSAHGSQAWSGSMAASFFVQTREGGVYTKLNLKVGINYNPDDPVTIELHGIANTNGSCNWEGERQEKNGAIA